jgi:hypothetical protein
MNGTRVLAENRAYFDKAAGAALAAGTSGDAERAMQWAKLAGECGWLMHPGFYTHPPLESMLHKLGQSLEPAPLPSGLCLPPRSGSGKNWLHIISTAFDVGGHTRLAEHLIVNASRGNADRHCIVLVDQGDVPVPARVAEAAAATGGVLLSLPGAMGLWDRARVVRGAAAWGDAVLLHVHPSDPVVPVAFARPGGAPVIFVNHADHVFWLGTRCCDLVAELRPEGRELTLARRGKLPSRILPIPLDIPRREVAREEARRALGLSEEQVALLAVASAYKFAPYGEHDFPAMAAELLRRHDEAVLLVVGPAADDPGWREALAASGDRLRLMGIRTDIASFYAAADICLESFPMGSLTSTLDAMLLEVPVVRSPRGVGLFGLSGYDGLEEAAHDIEQYLQQAGRYLGAPQARRAAGAAQRAGVLREHCGEGWLAAWQRLVAALPDCHRGSCCDAPLQWDAQDELDMFWGELQERQGSVTPDKGRYYRKRVRNHVRPLPRLQLVREWLFVLAGGDGKLGRLFRSSAS